MIMHDVFECPHADIAAALGTTTVNTRQYLARARRRLRENKDEVSPDEKLSRELIRRFQAAINGVDVPAMVALLVEEQPVFMRTSAQLRVRASACANDASYCVALAA